MKPRNKFSVLPDEDQNLVLRLCATHPYEEVAQILAFSREKGGLDLATSASALCRFYASRNPDPDRAVLAQYAAAAHAHHHESANAFLGAIRASVETRILEALRNGKALADMEKEFRLLKTAQNLYLQDHHWREKNPESARAAYQQHVERCAQAPDYDFMTPAELENLPARQTPLAERTDFERDLLQTRRKFQRQAQERTLLQAAGLPPELAEKVV